MLRIFAQLTEAELHPIKTTLNAAGNDVCVFLIMSNKIGFLP